MSSYGAFGLVGTYVAAKRVKIGHAHCALPSEGDQLPVVVQRDEQPPQVAVVARVAVAGAFAGWSQHVLLLSVVLLDLRVDSVDRLQKQHVEALALVLAARAPLGQPADALFLGQELLAVQLQQLAHKGDHGRVAVVRVEQQKAHVAPVARVPQLPACRKDALKFVFQKESSQKKMIDDGKKEEARFHD